MEAIGLRAMLVLSVAAAAASCSKLDVDYEVLASRNLRCPEGTHLEYLPWGKSGMRAVCIMEHGPIAIAEEGRLVIEGQFAHGKETGEWRWFDPSGAVERTMDYGKR